MLWSHCVVQFVKVFHVLLQGASFGKNQFDPTMINLVFFGAHGSKLDHQVKYLSTAPLQIDIDFLALVEIGQFNHSICDHMWLLIICNYIWTFLQLFFVLVIFAIIMQLVCDHFGVHPCMWTTFNLVFIQEEQFMSC